MNLISTRLLTAMMITLALTTIAACGPNEEEKKIRDIKVAAACDSIKETVGDIMFEPDAITGGAKSLAEYEEKFVKMGVIPEAHKKVALALWEKRDAWESLPKGKPQREVVDNIFDIVCRQVL